MPDALGSVRQAVDGSGAVVGAREWTPYGVEVGDAQAGLGYTGEWRDAAVGLQYLRARWYDARTGAFLTRDAVEENHPYQYANASPLRYTDPTGQCAREDVACHNDANYLYKMYGWLIHGYWDHDDVVTIRDAARSIRWFFQRNGGGDTAGRMRAAFGQVDFEHQAGILWNVLATGHVMRHSVFLGANVSKRLVIHEMGHILDNTLGPETAAIAGGGPSDWIAKILKGDPEQCPVRFRCELLGPCTWQTRVEPIQRKPNPEYAETGPSEDFADAFLVAVDGYSHYETELRPKRIALVEALVELQRDILPAYDPSGLSYPIFPVTVDGYPQ